MKKEIMKTTIISIVIAAALIGGAIFLTNRSASTDNSPPADNVSIVDGVQIIEIRAKGGFQPRKSTAQAGIPTVLRFNTSGTFDCSASVRIASMNISKTLPPSGATDISLGNAQSGTLRGSCGMGMYPFEINFKS